MIPGLGRSPGEGNGNPLQYSCLENPRGQRSLAGYSPGGRKRVRRLSDQAHYGTFVLQPGMEAMPPAMEHGVLNPGPPKKSLFSY